MDKKWLSFEQCRDFAHKSSARNQREWFQIMRQTDAPKNIPKNPYQVFSKLPEWKGMTDFLGKPRRLSARNYLYDSKNRRRNVSEFMSYAQARAYMAKFKLKGWAAWYKFRSSSLRPDTIHSTPEKYYKDKGWISMNDFLSM